MWRPERSEGATHSLRGYQCNVDNRALASNHFRPQNQIGRCAFKRIAMHGNTRTALVLTALDGTRRVLLQQDTIQ